MANTSEFTRTFIDSNPDFKKAVKLSIVNYSKLARIICKEAGFGNNDAFLVACRRYHDSIRREKQGILPKEIIADSTLNIRNGMCVVMLNPRSDLEHVISMQKELNSKNEIMHIIRGESSITLILPERYYDKICKMQKNSVISGKKKLIEVILRSSIKVESTRGVMAYICSLLAENGINIVEAISCWTDTMLIIDERDLEYAVKLLSKR